MVVLPPPLLQEKGEHRPPPGYQTWESFYHFLIEESKRRYADFSRKEVPFLFHSTSQEVDQFYIPLALVKIEEKIQHNDNEQESDLRLPSYERIDGKKEPIKADELFKPRQHKAVPPKLYVEGRAGSGKSTLLQYLAVCWSKGTQLTAFKWVIWLRLRELTGIVEEKKASSYPDIVVLQSLFFPGEKLSSKKQAAWRKYLEEQAGEILWLLDGYDEISDTHHPLIRAFIHYLCQPQSNARVMLTSRPQSPYPPFKKLAQQKEKEGILDYIETLGFNKEEQNNYIKQFYEKVIVNPERGEQLIHFLEKQPTVQRLATTPLNTQLICSLWNNFHEQEPKEKQQLLQQESDRRLGRLTDLYQLLISYAFKYYTLRKEPKEPGEIAYWGRGQEEESYPSIIRFLEYIAFYGLTDGNAVIHCDIIKKGFIEAIPFDERAKAIDLLKETGLLIPASSKQDFRENSYEFMHLTLQEYFAAKYIKRCQEAGTKIFVKEKTMTNEKKEGAITVDDFITRYLCYPRYEMMWYFFAGLVKGQQSLSFFKQLLPRPSTDLIGLRQCILSIRCLEEGWYALSSVGSEETVITQQLINTILHWMKIGFIKKEKATINYENKIIAPIKHACELSPQVMHHALFIDFILEELTKEHNRQEILQFIARLPINFTSNQTQRLKDVVLSHIRILPSRIFQHAEINQKEVIEVIAPLLSLSLEEDPNKSIRSKALDLLDELKLEPIAMKEAILSLLREKDREGFIRIKAWSLLNKLKLEPIAMKEILLPLFFLSDEEDPDGYIRRQAWYSLNKLKLEPREMKEAMLPLLSPSREKNPHRYICSEAWNLLGKLKLETREMKETLLPFLSLSDEEDPKGYIRSQAWDLFDKLKLETREVKEIILPFLSLSHEKDPEGIIRWLTLKLLDKLKLEPREMKEAILPFLSLSLPIEKDPERIIRWLALKLLDTLKLEPREIKEILQPLLSLSLEKEPKEYIRSQTWNLLDKLKLETITVKEAILPLLSLSREKDPDGSIRSEALKLLGKLKLEMITVKEILLPLLSLSDEEDSKGYIREQAWDLFDNLKLEMREVKEIILPLLSLSREKDLEGIIRWQALKLLSKFKLEPIEMKEAILPLLSLSLKKDPKGYFRCHALNLLGELKLEPKEMKEILQPLLSLSREKDPHRLISSKAWNLLGKLETITVKEAILPLLSLSREKDPDGSIRSQALNLLGKLKLETIIVKEIFLPLLSLSDEEDPKGYIRSEAWDLLGKLETITVKEIILPFLSLSREKDPKEYIRSKAWNLLDKLKLEPREMKEILLPLLSLSFKKDTEGSIRSKALSLLGKLKLEPREMKEAILPLLSLSHEKEPEGYTRYEALKLLGELKLEPKEMREMKEILLPLLSLSHEKDPDGYIRCKALNLLGELKLEPKEMREMKEILLPLLPLSHQKDPDGYIRSEAWNLLGKLKLEPREVKGILSLIFQLTQEKITKKDLYNFYTFLNNYSPLILIATYFTDHNKAWLAFLFDFFISYGIYLSIENNKLYFHDIYLEKSNEEIEQFKKEWQEVYDEYTRLPHSLPNDNFVSFSQSPHGFYHLPFSTKDAKGGEEKNEETDEYELHYGPIHPCRLL